MNEATMISNIVDRLTTATDTLIEQLMRIVRNKFVKPTELWSQTIFIHFILSLVWFGIIFLCSLTWSNIVDVFYGNWEHNPAIQIFNKYLLYYPIILLNIYLLLPFLWHKRKYSLYIATIFIVAIYCTLMSKYILAEVQTANDDYIVQLYSVVIVFAISGLVRYVYQELAVSARTIVLERQKMRLALEKNALELNNIKLRVAQLKPHFLLNALNNIDTLLLLQRTDAAAQSLRDLSEILQYLLYDSDKKSISLDNEIKHIRSIIQLETLRFRNLPQINLQINGKTEQIMIPPLLLTPLIENAFKHFDPTNRWININIDLFLHKISICVANSKPPKNNTNPNQYGGLGIKRLEERLANLYPNQIPLLQIDNSKADTFIATLHIPITSPIKT